MYSCANIRIWNIHTEPTCGIDIYIAINCRAGTNVPDSDIRARVHIKSGNSGFPYTTGVSAERVILRLNDGSGNNTVMDFGMNGTSGGWIQSTQQNSYALTYPLLLNPNGGNVGINTTNPSSTLDVNGYTQSASGYNSYLDTSGGGLIHYSLSTTGKVIRWGLGLDNGTATSRFNIWSYTDAGGFQANPVSIERSTTPSIRLNTYVSVNGASDLSFNFKVFGNGIATGAFFNASDIRIKENIVDASGSVSLSTINSLQLKRYNYIDKILSGNDGTVYGIIAQQIQEVLPEAVRISTEIIPSIMSYSTAYYVIDPSGTPFTVKITLDASHNIIVGTIVRIVNEWSDDGVQNEKYEDVACIDVSGNEFTFSMTKEVFRSLSQVFVYGIQVNDFCAVDKAKVFMPMIGAIQELSRIKDEQAARITALEAQNAALQAQIDAIKAHIGMA